MQILSLSEIESFIQKVKNGKKLVITGEYDPDPYGGGTHWDYEMYYDYKWQKFVLKTNFYPSQYHNEPEISYLNMNEEQAISHLLRQDKNKVSCW